MPDMAKIAYEAYRAFHDGRGSYRPTWENLSPSERSAWDAAAQAVLCEIE